MLERDARGSGQHRWNPALLELAQECGFVPRLCRPYRAQTKGQVERFNRYLKQSFWVPLRAQLRADGLELDAATTNQAVRRWLHGVANQRVHATTGAIPAQRLETERPLLLPPRRLAVPAAAPRAEPLPVESLQHPLCCYDALLTDQLRECLEVRT